MDAGTFQNWGSIFEQKLSSLDLGNDPAHDLAHFRRVASLAQRLALQEGARLEIVLPAAWFHDWVNLPKNDPRRSQASRLSAHEATLFLRSQKYPEELLDDIAHAIEAHSYSADITARTLEAQVVQDADRLDGIGAIGIARCFSVGSLLGRRFYDPDDPFGRHGRNWDDQSNTLDHFYVKLFRIAETLLTRSGREEGVRRVEAMKQFLANFEAEIQERGETR